jgi:hypothetical protein
MEFKTEIYIGLKSTYIGGKIAYVSFFAMIVLYALLFMYTTVTIPYLIVFIVMVTLFLTIVIAVNILSYFERETYTYVNEIPLVINPYGITIGEQVYHWTDIKNIAISYSDYLDKYRYDRNPRPHFSAGVDNYLRFTTKDGEQISYSFKIYSKFQIDMLRQIFTEMARQKTISFEDIKKLYQPVNYADTQALKALYAQSV